MARPVRGCPTPQPLEGTGEPETNSSAPQQEEQSDAAEGKVIVDCNLDVDYEGSEPENESVAQEKKEESYNAEYANMDIPRDRTFHQRMMPCNIL